MAGAMHVRTAQFLRYDALGALRIKRGTLVMLSPYAMHRDPRWWTDPDAFRPERFTQDGAEAYAWLPFGGGIRRCIGAALAQAAIDLIRMRGMPFDAFLGPLGDAAVDLVRRVARHALGGRWQPSPGRSGGTEPGCGRE